MAAAVRRAVNWRLVLCGSFVLGAVRVCRAAWRRSSFACALSSLIKQNGPSILYNWGPFPNYRAQRALTKSAFCIMPPHSPWVQPSKWRHLGFSCCGAQPYSPSAFPCTGARRCVACKPHSPSIGRFARSSGRRGSLAPWCSAGRSCLSPFVHPLGFAPGAALSTFAVSAHPLRWFSCRPPSHSHFGFRGR